MIFQGFDTVMFGDTDASGMGHFAHQVHFLERAEFQFMSHVGINPPQWFSDRYLFPRVHLSIDYTAPLHFGDAMQFNVQVGHVGRSSYSLVTEVINLTKGEVAMKARVVIVALDKATGQTIEVPKSFRDVFLLYQIDHDGNEKE